MTDYGKIKVSKVDAARRQLDCAIKLWFAGGDNVSIHTLVFAAYEILNALNKKAGNTDATLLGMVQVIARPGHIEDVMNIFKAPMTFFKHADRDPLGVLEFAPKATDILIALALKGFAATGERLTDIQDAFMQYLLLHNPTFLKDGVHPFAQYVGTDQIVGMKQISKAEFVNAFLEGRAKRSRI